MYRYSMSQTCSGYLLWFNLTSKLSALPILLYPHPTINDIDNIVFKFDDGFSMPVYVTYAHNKVEHDVVKQKILASIFYETDLVKISMQ